MVIEKFFQHPRTSDDISVAKTFNYFNYHGDTVNQSYYPVPNTFFINDICNLLDEANIEYQKIEDYGLKIFNNNYYFYSLNNNNYDTCIYILQDGCYNHRYMSYMRMCASSQYYPDSYHYKIRLVTNSESYFMIQVYDSDSSIIDYDQVHATKSLIFSTKCNIVNDNTELIFTTNALYYNDNDNINIIFNSGYSCNTLINPNDVKNSLKEFFTINDVNTSYHINCRSPFTIKCNITSNPYIPNGSMTDKDCNYWNPEQYFNRFNLIDKVLLKPINLYNNILNTKDIYILPRNFGQENIDNTIIEIDNEEYYIFNITNSKTYKDYIPMCVKI